MDEKHDKFTMHCTCVPALRMRVKELEAQLERERNEKERGWNQAHRFGEQVAELEAQLAAAKRKGANR